MIVISLTCDGCGKVEGRCFTTDEVVNENVLACIPASWPEDGICPECMEKIEAHRKEKINGMGNRNTEATTQG